ncbi:MAG: hypothetical protein BGO67_09945 [Alphaproteobacteria bacterium 41-28]|nr:MAG: hypothetical protein BGO67_09945 [Alphaproteobacteria bacterium 41-28]
MIRRPYRLFYLALTVALLIAVSSFNLLAEDLLDQRTSHLEMTSSAFQDSKFIPPEYTAEGKDVSPPLAWKNIPKGTRSLALISDDPDAPNGWVHWVLYNIPATLTHIDEGGKNLPSSVLPGTNSFGNLGYNGPNPPQGVHHYHFNLYALDAIVPLKKGATNKELLKAIEDHILDVVTLTGLYQKRG